MNVCGSWPRPWCFAPRAAADRDTFVCRQVEFALAATLAPGRVRTGCRRTALEHTGHCDIVGTGIDSTTANVRSADRCLVSSHPAGGNLRVGGTHRATCTAGKRDVKVADLLQHFPAGTPARSTVSRMRQQLRDLQRRHQALRMHFESESKAGATNLEPVATRL